MEPAQLVAVAAIVTAGSLLGGLGGFGYGLVAAPLLLTVGVPLPTIVVLNLVLGIITRGVAAWRLRHAATRVTVLMIAGSVPGYTLGVVLLERVDVHALKVTTGVVVVLLALLSLRREPFFSPGRASFVCAGVAGGALGATTSLNGVVPALVLGQVRGANSRFIADMAVYFVGSSVIGMVAVAVGGVSAPNVWALVAIALPVSIAANLVGTSLGTRMPKEAFRVLTSLVAICAGLVAIFS